MQLLSHNAVTLSPNAPTDKACLFVESDSDFKNNVNLLTKTEWCENSQKNSVECHLSLTFKGWQKFEELNKNWQESTTAFIAMWFDDSTKNYREAAQSAIVAAGYQPLIIDSIEHNNFIMDEVINKINEARFVIADFTCVPERPESNGKIPGGVRGGVYFEAGYARGLGKEVIMTCRDSDEAKQRRHFDIDQLNTLFWTENDGKLTIGGDDFAKRLAEHIKATVGRGPDSTIGI